jgi:hypothetical protein
MENIFDELPKDQTQDNETIFTKRDPVRQFAADHAGLKTTEAEPNWHQMLLRAANESEKFRIRAARDTWQAEQKQQAHQKQMAADQARVDALQSVHIRNKSFWDALQRTDGRVYWSPAAQRLMREDKKNQGLGFFSKK